MEWFQTKVSTRILDQNIVLGFQCLQNEVQNHFRTEIVLFINSLICRTHNIRLNLVNFTFPYLSRPGFTEDYSGHCRRPVIPVILVHQIGITNKNATRTLVHNDLVWWIATSQSITIHYELKRIFGGSWMNGFVLKSTFSMRVLIGKKIFKRENLYSKDRF